MKFVKNIYESQPDAQCAMLGYSGMKTPITKPLCSNQLLNNATMSADAQHSNVCFYTLAVAVISSALFSISARADEPATSASLEKSAATSPWGFNLSPYLWLPGISGDLSAQQQSSSVDASFIDIVDKSRRFPLGFMGHFEAHYERFGFFLDGVYMNIKLDPVLKRLSNGISSELGIMDYGLTYRIFGATAAEMPGWQGKTRPIALDVRAGARTIWLDNSVELAGPADIVQRNFSSSKSFTSPIIGGRIIVDFTPHWFVMADGDVGGFGAQNVDFTGSILGALGYRTAFFDIPASVEAGYKALFINVDGDTITAKTTLDGPFIGLTGYW
ncbi:MAG: hypothetical protein PHD43_12785 [Methylococcales bacterium]|nr:hypothetical protein [Methylococcales bacterium]